MAAEHMTRKERPLHLRPPQWDSSAVAANCQAAVLVTASPSLASTMSRSPLSSVAVSAGFRCRAPSWEM